MKSVFRLIVLTTTVAVLVFNACNRSLAEDSKLRQPGNAWQANGPYGGQVGCIVADSKGQLFVGTRDGVFRSSDDGEHWVNTELPMNDENVIDISFSPKGEIFAAAREYALVSTDGGTTWKQNHELLPQDITRRVFTPSGRSILYNSAYAKGVFRSDDGIAGWKPVNTGLSNLSVHALILGPRGHLLAGTQAGLFVSIDEGDNWQRVDMRIPGENNVVWDIVRGADESLFALAGAAIYTSSDGGDTWTKVYDSANSDRGRLAVSPTGQIFLATSVGLCCYPIKKGEGYPRSITIGSDDAKYYRMGIAPNGHLFATNSLGGIFKSVDGGHVWTLASNGLTGDPVDSLAVDPIGKICACASTDIYVSSTDGKTWKVIDSSLKHYPSACMVIARGGRLIVGKSNGVSYSDDGGRTWIQPVGIGHFISGFAVGPKGSVFAYGDRSDMYRSTDNGGHWVKLDNGKTAGESLISRRDQITNIAVGPDGSLYVIGHSAGIYRSTDNGGHWVHIDSLPQYPGIDSINFGPAGVIIASSLREMYTSSDNGERWVKQDTTPFMYNDINAILIDHDGTEYVGARHGVYYSTDHGQHWIRMDGAFPSHYVLSLAFSADKFLLVGTRAHGVLRFPRPHAD